MQHSPTQSGAESTAHGTANIATELLYYQAYSYHYIYIYFQYPVHMSRHDILNLTRYLIPQIQSSSLYE